MWQSENYENSSNNLKFDAFNTGKDMEYNCEDKLNINKCKCYGWCGNGWWKCYWKWNILKMHIFIKNNVTLNIHICYR